MSTLFNKFKSQFSKKEEPDYGSMAFLSALAAYCEHNNLKDHVDKDYFRDKVWQPAKVKAILKKDEIYSLPKEVGEVFMKNADQVIEVHRPPITEPNSYVSGIDPYKKEDNNSDGGIFTVYKNGEHTIESIPVAKYEHMPQGLKEAQQANGVKDHDLIEHFTENEKIAIDSIKEDHGQEELFSPTAVIFDNHKLTLPKESPMAQSMLSKALEQAEPNNELIHYKEITEESYDGKTLDNSFIDEVGQFEVPKQNKLRASQIEEHGIVFDSKLENYMYNLLTKEGFDFRFQVEYILQEGFVYRHENIRPMAIVMDFILDDHQTIIDTKGWQLQDNKLKHKLLKNKLHQLGTEMRIEMPSSQKACRALIEMLRNGFTLTEPLTEHAATARKNKLKKNKWEWVDGSWVKSDKDGIEISVKASKMMNLPKYEFEELLINYK